MSDDSTPNIPAGRYMGRAVRVSGEDGDPIIRWGYAGEANTKQCLVYFEITEGEFSGQVVPWFGYFTEKTWKRTVESLRIAGFTGDDLSEVEDHGLNEDVQLQVGWNTNPSNGKTHARVEWVNRIGSGAIKLNKPMPSHELRGFAAQMKSRLKSVPNETGPRASGSRTTNGKPPAQEEDDIPF